MSENLPSPPALPPQPSPSDHAPGARVHGLLAPAELVQSLPLLSLPGLEEIGGGWFLSFSLQPALQAFVVDAYGPHPDIRYTPAAWGGEDGPSEGQVLITLLDQAFAATMDAMHEPPPSAEAAANLPQEPVESVAPWPALAEVSDWGQACGLGHLEGTQVDSVAQALALARAVLATRPALALRRLPLSFAQARSHPDD